MGSHDLKWEAITPNIPIDHCWPYGRVAEINGILHVGWVDRMLQLKEGAWKGQNHHLDIWIMSIFECEGQGYVIHGNGVQFKSIYKWESEARQLELLTEIPDEYLLDARSAIGHNGKIYLAGGVKSDRVDCFDIKKGEWKPIKKMKNQREWCSLTVIDNKIFVGGGGGGGGKSVEYFLIEEKKWIDIEPTTNEHCQLSSLNGKLIATGGWEGSSKGSERVELYDESSGSWLPLPPMNNGRDGHGACTTKDNELIVLGGRPSRNGASWNSVERLNCN